MAFQVKKGTFSTRNGTGTQQITGVGFQPKGIIFWGNREGGDNVRSGPGHMRQGFSDGVTNIGIAWNNGDYFSVFESCETGLSNTNCLVASSILAGPFLTPAVILLGYVQSMDTDGFTINITTNQGGLCNGHIWHYMAFGGAGVNCKVGYYTGLGAAGNKAVTGVGFKPTALFAWYNAAVATTGNGPGTSPNLAFAAECNLAVCGLSNYGYELVNPSRQYTYQRGTKFVSYVNSSGALGFDSTLVSMDADGFTVNQSAGFGPSIVPYLAINGCSANVGTFTQPTTTGAQAVSILMSLPKAVFILANGKVSGTVPTTDTGMMLGGGDQALNQGATWLGDLNGQTPPYKVDEESTTSKIISISTPTGADTHTVNAEAALVSLSEKRINLNWMTVDATQRQLLYCVLGTEVVSGSCGEVPTATLIKAGEGELDVDEIFQAYVITKCYGAGVRLGAADAPILVAKAATNVPVQLSMIRDHTIEVELSSRTLTPDGAETRVIKKYETVDLADISEFQVKLGDAVAIENRWALDHFQLPVIREGEK